MGSGVCDGWFRRPSSGRSPAFSGVAAGAPHLAVILLLLGIYGVNTLLWYISERTAAGWQDGSECKRAFTAVIMGIAVFQSAIAALPCAAETRFPRTVLGNADARTLERGVRRCAMLRASGTVLETKARRELEAVQSVLQNQYQQSTSSRMESMS